MRKLVFTLAIIFGLMSFNSTINSSYSIEDKNDLISSSYTIQIETLNGEAYRCRWRWCHYEGGTKVCTPWEYGECLDEIVIRV